MPSFTTNLNLTKPDVGGSADTWGGLLNADLDSLDTVFNGAGNGTSVGLNVGSGKTLTIAGNVSAGATTITPTELSYLDGVTSNIQTQFTGKASTGANSTITSLTGLTTALSAPQGGTGQASYTVGDVLYASSTTAVSKLAIGSTGQVLSVVSGIPAWSSSVATSAGGTGLTTFTAANNAIYSTSATALTAGTLPIAAGGTSATTAAGARTALGLGAADSVSFNKVTASSGSGGGFNIGSAASFAEISGSGFLNFTSITSIFGNNSQVTNSVNAQTVWISSPTTFTINSAITPYTTNAWVVTSDQRAKKDIADYSIGLAAIKSLRTVSYKFNGSLGTVNDERPRVGLLAQEVLQTQLSNIVQSFEHKDEATGETTTMYGLQSEGIIFALINAVKELDARVKALEAGVAK